jgi:hypothetical protein
MNDSACFEVPMGMHPLKGPSENAGVDNSPQKACPDEQSWQRSPEQSDASDDGASEAFIDGAGI